MPSTLARLSAATALIFVSAGPADAQRREPPRSREAVQMSYAPIVKRASPAVVNVFVRGRVQVKSPFDDPILRRFFGEQFGMPQERMQSSLGSGVIVSPDGIVVTNTHVIKTRGTAEIRVVLADRREFDAEVVQQDEKTDIAILRIQGGDGRFAFLEFENSDAVEVGDLVLAIGNPFGVGQTVTHGIISALARSEVGKSDAQVFIQTDAAINPGNSGGALVDMAGRLIGINTAIFSRSGGSHGIGFAIPSNLAKLYVDSAVTGRKLERPWLGARLDAVTRDIAEGFGLERPVGAIVTRVHAMGPAADARLQPGDVIIAVDGHDVGDPRAVQYRLTTRGVGQASLLTIIRKGQRIPVELRLEAAPKPGRDDVRNLTGQHPFDGLRVANLSPALADELGIEAESGVVILQVRPDSVAARLGFRPGDIVARIGDSEIDVIATLEETLKKRPRTWGVAVKRGTQVLTLQVPG
jgi:Do/DeqQ family serine protease